MRWPSICPVLLLVLVVFTPVMADTNTSPVIVREPGLYTLDSDLSWAGGLASVTIQSSDVTLDGMGHSIVFLTNDASGQTGIQIGEEDQLLENITVKNLTVHGYGAGIVVNKTTGLNLVDISCTGNRYGIWLIDSNDAILKNLLLSRNNRGIFLNNVKNTTITRCSVTNNTETGFFFWNSAGNVIVDNIISNTHNAGFDDTIPQNTWDLGKAPGSNIIGGGFTGGNFWGSPDGTGFSEIATDADGDGIADSAFRIAAGNIDHAPLCKSSQGGKSEFTESVQFVLTPRSSQASDYILQYEIVDDKGIISSKTERTCSDVNDTNPVVISFLPMTGRWYSVNVTLLSADGRLVYSRAHRFIQEQQPVSGTGTVRFLDVEGGFYGVLGDGGERYLPLTMPQDFQKDGLRVRFTAKLRSDISTVFQWGTVVEILEISVLKQGESPGT